MKRSLTLLILAGVLAAAPVAHADASVRCNLLVTGHPNGEEACRVPLDAALSYTINTASGFRITACGTVEDEVVCRTVNQSASAGQYSGTIPAAPGWVADFAIQIVTISSQVHPGGTVTPGQTIPGQTITQTVPGQTVPGQTIPGATDPGHEVVPSQTLPSQTVVPSQTVPVDPAGNPDVPDEVTTPPVTTPPVGTPPVGTPPVNQPPTNTPPETTPPVTTPPVSIPAVNVPAVVVPPVGVFQRLQNGHILVTSA